MSAVIVRNYNDAYAVTPNDTADLPHNGTVALRVAGTGVVKVNVKNGSQGIVIPVSVDNDLCLPITRVLATGTTATGIVALV